MFERRVYEGRCFRGIAMKKRLLSFVILGCILLCSIGNEGVYARKKPSITQSAGEQQLFAQDVGKRNFIVKL